MVDSCGGDEVLRLEREKLIGIAVAADRGGEGSSITCGVW